MSHSEDATVSVADAAALLGISISQAYRMIYSGTLTSLQLGRRMVVPMCAITGLLENRTN